MLSARLRAVQCRTINPGCIVAVERLSQLATDFGTSFVAIVIPMQDAALNVGFTRNRALFADGWDNPARWSPTPAAAG